MLSLRRPSLASNRGWLPFLPVVAEALLEDRRNEIVDRCVVVSERNGAALPEETLQHGLGHDRRGRLVSSPPLQEGPETSCVNAPFAGHHDEGADTGPGKVRADG